MVTKLQKWGNSLGVRLPKSIAAQKDLREGSSVSISIANNRIVIESIVEEVSLKSLLSEVSTNNLHVETDWSDVRGNEVW
jgi:antitoxin MazE